VLVFAPDWATAVAVGLISVVSAWEFMGASDHAESRGFGMWRVLSCALAALVCYGTFRAWDGIRGWLLALMYGLFALGLLIFLLNTARAHLRGGHVFTSISQCVIIAGLGLPLCLSAIIWLRIGGYGRYLVLVPIISAFITDAGAYAVGMTLGKHRPFPNISPKKSIEGFVGGLIIGTAAMVLFGVIMRTILPDTAHVSLVNLAIVGLAGAIVTEVGDLAFSLVKRERGIKDFGKLLPGHGGMLDRFDSMVFCAPVVWALSLAFPVIW
jgi:phosphatidate cytidylyltransferase